VHVNAANGTVRVQVVDEGGGFASEADVPFVPGMNVQSALEGAYNVQAPPQFHFFLEYFGSEGGVYFGYLVTQFNATADAGSTNWMLYVNNVQAPTGIDTTVLNDGDQVLFTYEQYSAETHGAIPIVRAQAERAAARAAG
jgi:hypothetical protein